MANAEQPLVSVVIVSHNTRALLQECLRSLAEHGGPTVGEILVIDNASTDGSQELVRTEFPTVRLIAHTANVGFGRASNQGVADAKGAYVLLLNSDTLVQPGAVDALLAELKADRRVGLVGPRLVHLDGRLQRSAFRFPTPPVLLLEQLSLAPRLPLVRLSPQHTTAVDWLLGACLLGSRDLLLDYGPFDPRFFMYGEDIDLCYRLHAGGWEVRMVPGAEIIHRGGGSSRQAREDMAVQATRSMYLFYRLHYAPAALRQVQVIFRVVAALKWLRDASSLLLLSLGGGMEGHRRQPRQDLRVWSRIIRLEP